MSLGARFRVFFAASGAEIFRSRPRLRAGYGAAGRKPCLGGCGFQPPFCGRMPQPLGEIVFCRMPARRAADADLQLRHGTLHRTCCRGARGCLIRFSSTATFVTSDDAGRNAAEQTSTGSGQVAGQVGRFLAIGSSQLHYEIRTITVAAHERVQQAAPRAGRHHDVTIGVPQFREQQLDLCRGGGDALD